MDHSTGVLGHGPGWQPGRDGRDHGIALPGSQYVSGGSPFSARARVRSSATSGALAAT